MDIYFCVYMLLFGQSADLVINQRLLELFYGIKGQACYDIVIGDICSLPSHPCQS